VHTSLYVSVDVFTRQQLQGTPSWKLYNCKYWHVRVVEQKRELIVLNDHVLDGSLGAHILRRKCPPYIEHSITSVKERLRRPSTGEYAFLPSCVPSGRGHLTPSIAPLSTHQHLLCCCYSEYFLVASLKVCSTSAGDDPTQNTLKLNDVNLQQAMGF
jgi:hypothetical protein